MLGKKQISKVGALASVTTLCAALGASAAIVQAQAAPTVAPSLPNCAVTTAAVGTLEVTEFFGLPATGTDFAQSFGLMPNGMASGTAASNGNGTGAGLSNGNGAGGATGATGANTGTGTNATTATTGGNTGTATNGGGAMPTTATSGANANTAGFGNGNGMISLAQSCIRLEVANPSPGDMLQPGGYVVEGFAFDPTTPASQGSGIAGVQVFLGDPNEGGTILGSTSANQTSATSADQFGLSNSRAAGFGEQFANAGFRLTVQIPTRQSNTATQGNEALFVAATTANGNRVGTVAVPVSVANPTAANRAP